MDSAKDGLLQLTTPQGPYSVAIQSPGVAGSCSLERAAENSARGWRAPIYQARAPALSWRLETTAASCWFWSLLGPGPCVVEWAEPAMVVRSKQWRAELKLGRGPSAGLVERIALEGKRADELVLSSCTYC